MRSWVPVIVTASLTVGAACKVLPPPPVLPPHAATTPDPVGATTAMLVIGMAGELVGGGGVGLALRVEHQETDHSTLGFELTGGRGADMLVEGRGHERVWLVAARAYGRTAYAADTDLAVTYGVGLGVQSTGLVTGTLHAGGMASYPGDHVVPVGALALALAVPLRGGRAYGEPPLNLNFGEPDPPGAGLPRPPVLAVPRTELYVALDVGALVPIGGTGNRLSLDAGAAYATRADSAVLALSAADAQRFAR